MTKGEFILIYNTCNGASQAIFNKLGLFCKKFTKQLKGVYEDIADEELFISYEFGAKDGDTFKRQDQGKGAVIIKAESQKDYDKKMKALHKETISNEAIELIKNFEKKEVDSIIIATIPPTLFDILNDVIFTISDDQYLEILALEQSK